MGNESEKLKTIIRAKLRSTPRIPATISEYMANNGRKGGRNGTHANKVKAGKAGAAKRWGSPLRSQKAASN